MDLLGMGSLVRLKCRGQLMTAVEFPKQQPGMVVCAWIDRDGKPQRESYPEIALDVFVTEERLRLTDGIMGRVRENAGTEKAN